ncbi:MAG: cytochrome c biogenesis protein CcdA [Actinomycetia bacterium]|nr:cytochrome c biogenesis protein CcdA [Actinomycetes bacterium]
MTASGGLTASVVAAPALIGHLPASVGADVTSTVASGPLPLALFFALLAGLVSFLSPCVLPLVPGYLGYVTGLSELSLAERRRHRMVLGAALFVLGFSVIFILATIFITSIGRVFVEHRVLLSRIGGVLVILMALVFIGMGSQRSARLSARPGSGLAGAPVLGATFALGWAPCTGPTLVALFAMLSSLEPDYARATTVAGAYCLGLGLPFILIAGLYERSARWSSWLRDRQRAIQLIGGGFLMLVGVLLVTGVWERVNRWIQANWLAGFEVIF